MNSRFASADFGGTMDYAIFQSHGYAGLHGGLVAQDIHARKGLKKGAQPSPHCNACLILIMPRLHKYRGRDTK